MIDPEDLRAVYQAALAAYGLQVAPADLEDGTPRRRAA
jgi:hypothetical protein